jgi:Cytochrome P460
MTASNDPKPERVVDASGNLRVPDDYRTPYQFLGSWAVAADQGQGSKEIHVVYASPGAAAAYRKNGRSADGSVLVKEVCENDNRSDDHRHCQPRPSFEGLVRVDEGQ